MSLPSVAVSMTNGDDPTAGPDGPPEEGKADRAERSERPAGGNASPGEPTAVGAGGRTGSSGGGPPEDSRGGSDGGWGFDASTYVVLVVAGLLVGALVAPIAVNVTSQTSTGPTVAIVPLAGSIDGVSASRVSAQIERARQDPSVEAVVLRVNSGGGGASASETLYLSVKRLAEEKPVVVSVDGIAASGAYYASVPGDVIYAKPASVVGSVGAFAPIPAEVEPNQIIAATGPEKVGVGSERGFKYTVESIKRAFANAVMANRGENLTIPRSTVTKAGIYTGASAAQNGMVDEIGGLRTATARAAELAELGEYNVRVYSANGTTRFVSRAAFVASAAEDKEMVSPTYLTGLGGTGSSQYTVLMLPPSIAYDSRQQASYVGAGAYEPRADERGNRTGAPARTPAGGEGR